MPPRMAGKEHEILAQVSVGLAAKWLEIIAQGFSPGLTEPTSALKVAPEAVCVQDWVWCLDLFARPVTGLEDEDDDEDENE